jgi:phenylacetate-CoA ligase
VEVVDDAGAPVWNSPGRVLVTLLSNRAMPLIRYELGDTAIMSQDPCPCGRASPLLRSVLGRSSDFLVSPGGRVIHGEYFTHIFYGRPSVRQFQFVQETQSRYDLSIVRCGELSGDEVEGILREIREVLGSDAEIRVSYPDAIAPSPSGKHRFTICKVGIPAAP